MNTLVKAFSVLVLALVVYFSGNGFAVLLSPMGLALAFILGVLASTVLSRIKPSHHFDGLDDDERDDMPATQTLYVGNLPYRTNESAVKSLFADYGTVISVRLLKDKHTGKRRGFGFVEMEADDADKAISALNEHEYQQRTLKVRVANERKDD